MHYIKDWYCKKNAKNSSATKAIKHILSGFSMSTISSFRGTENKHNLYRGRDRMKKFCDSLRDHEWRYLILKRKKWSY